MLASPCVHGATTAGYESRLRLPKASLSLSVACQSTETKYEFPGMLHVTWDACVEMELSVQGIMHLLPLNLESPMSEQNFFQSFLSRTSFDIQVPYFHAHKPFTTPPHPTVRPVPTRTKSQRNSKNRLLTERHLTRVYIYK